MDKQINNFFAENAFSRNTEDRYRRAIRQIAEDLELEFLSAGQLKDWLESRGWGGSTKWVAFCAIRGFVRWMWGDSHPALALRIQREESGPQRSLKPDQVFRLLASFDTSKILGIRDLGLCSLVLDTGLRSSEVCSLDLVHVDISERRLDVRVKGGRWCVAVFSEFTALYLSNWLAVRDQKAKRGVTAFFVSTTGKTPGQRMTKDGLGKIVGYWGKRIGIKLSPHDLRRTFVEVSIRQGAPDRLVQLAGRWQDVRMVQHYSRNLEAVDFEPYFPVASVMR